MAFVLTGVAPTVLAMADIQPLAGLRVEGFRSFAGVSPQQISPLTKVHLLAGPNNSGKSNVLRVAQRVLPAVANRVAFTPELSDHPYGQPDTSLRVGIARGSSIDELGERLGIAHQADLLLRLLGESGLWDSEESLLWFDFEFHSGPGAWQLAAWQADRITDAAEEAGVRPQLGELSTRLSQAAGGGREDDAGRVLSRMVDALEARTALPMVQTLDAFRRIEPAQSGEGGELNGPGLIERLAQLQHPPTAKRPTASALTASISSSARSSTMPKQASRFSTTIRRSWWGMPVGGCR